jgi:hypothetical protein
MAEMSAFPRALHNTPRGDTLPGIRSRSANIAMAFLHDDTEDDSLVDTNLGALLDYKPQPVSKGSLMRPSFINGRRDNIRRTGHQYPPHIIRRIPRCKHGRLVPIEHIFERDPLIRAWEVLRWPAVVLVRHRGESRAREADEEGELHPDDNILS